MNTPTKRIFYLFEPKFAKNEPQTKVWGSLTCKSQFLRLAESVSCAFAEAGSVPVRAGRSRSRLVVQPFAAAFTPVAAACARARAVRAGRARSRWSQPVPHTFAPVAAGCARSRCSRWSRPIAGRRLPARSARRRAGVLLDAGLLLGALDSSHLLLGKPNGTVIFSVVRSGTAVVTQVGTSCFQRRHVV